MRHCKSFNKLNRTHSERKALYKNMILALFSHNRIKTTVAKAREIRRVSEKIITRAKEKNLHNIRIIAKIIKDKTILKKLFDEIAPRYATRNGGYTRIIKADKRKGDGADLAFLELLTDEVQTKKKKKKIKKEEIKKQDDVKATDIKEESKKDEVKQEVKAEEVSEKKEEAKVDDGTTTQIKE